MPSVAAHSGLERDGWLFRGIHAGPPCARCRKGRPREAAKSTRPDHEGPITPEQHDLGGVSAQSPYTSWTRRLQVARNYAGSAGPGGVVLAVPPGAPLPGDEWGVYSPDAFWEDEILLRGVRRDVRVLPC